MSVLRNEPNFERGEAHDESHEEEDNFWSFPIDQPSLIKRITNPKE